MGAPNRNSPVNDYSLEDRAALFEELRFLKRQQWAIATSAVTLLGAVFAISRSVELTMIEKGMATVFLILIAGFGVTFLYDAGFPHVIQALQPDGRYFFSYAVLRPHIKSSGPLGVFK